MLGKVQINNLNLFQGALPQVENYFLFIGAGAGQNEGKLLHLNQETDLAATLGDCDLQRQLAAARLNAGQNWQACAIPLAEEETWESAAAFAMERVSVEGIVLTDPLQSAAGAQAMQAYAEGVMARYMRPLVMAGRARALDEGETWEDYLDALRPLTDGIMADQVTLTPTLFGTELGAYIGRLCNSAVTVADTPMRVATGPLVGAEWAKELRPQDSAGRLLDLAVLEALDAARFSVPQYYPDYPGIYWADGNTLDAPGGDYQAIENLRVMQKAMRRIYPLAVAKIGDRALNQTPFSLANAQKYFMRPLREMAQSRMILGQSFPGEIEPPKDGDIAINWPGKNQVEIGIAARPYNCPKKITCNLLLDLANYA